MSVDVGSAFSGDDTAWLWALAVVAALLALVQTLRMIALRAWHRWIARRRTRHGLRGEGIAERLLEKHGYRIVARQAKCTLPMWVDGREIELGLRIDLVVERDGQRFVAEVKTGAGARPDSRATRRQLLEYCVAAEARGALLVDADARRIHTVEFALPFEREGARVSGASRPERTARAA